MQSSTRAWRLRKMFALGALACSLVACGGGGGGSGPGDTGMLIATAADNLFPLDSNSLRVYATTDPTGSYTERFVGAQTVAGGVGSVLRAVNAAGTEVDSSVYVVNSDGVRVFAATGATDALDRAFDGVAIIRWPVQAGDSHVQVDGTFEAGEDFDGDGRGDTITLRSVLTAVGRESVSTAAGSFPDSLHQRQTVGLSFLPSGGGNVERLDVVIDEWYAPNVGLVKRMAVTSWAGAPPTTITETLTAYRVGARSSDRTPPTVASVTPGPAAVRGEGLMVNARFNKDLDPESLQAAGSFTVVDSAGARIPGAVQVNGQTVHFMAAQSWASGSYTATVSTAASDVLGNALASARSWTFTVDATAPGVVSISPASEAVDVDVAASLALVFSEPPDPATVNDVNVRLSSNSSSSLPVVLRLEGSRLTVTPVSALEPAQVYTLTVSGLTDAVGNPLGQPLASRFLTSQGRFAFNQSLFPNWSVQELAINDFNGDGLPDVLALGRSNGLASEQGLVLRTGRPDGSLSDEVLQDIGALVACQSRALAVGDINGDGRTDAVIGGGLCGTQVLVQSAAGTLLAGQTIDLVLGDSMRIADLDGDGRPELVMGSGSTSSISIWRRGTDGLLARAASIDLGGPTVKQIELGDIDGDGRIDIVAAIGGGLGQHVAVLRQTASGSFASPEILSTGSDWGASAVALGDLNGDGRVDIVATTGGNSPTHLAVYYQAAGGAIGPLTRVATYDIPSGVRVADIDGNGLADIVVSHRGWSAVGLYLQQADGRLLAEQRFRAPYGGFSPALALGDINRDGRPDILVDGDWLRQLPMAAGASGQPPRPTALRLRGVGLLGR